MSQQPYLWNANNPLSFSDPNGFCWTGVGGTTSGGKNTPWSWQWHVCSWDQDSISACVIGCVPLGPSPDDMRDGECRGTPGTTLNTAYTCAIGHQLVHVNPMRLPEHLNCFGAAPLGVAYKTAGDTWQLMRSNTPQGYGFDAGVGIAVYNSRNLVAVLSALQVPTDYAAALPLTLAGAGLGFGKSYTGC